MPGPVSFGCGAIMPDLEEEMMGMNDCQAVFVQKDLASVSCQMYVEKRGRSRA
jgi:hypothetical protein